MDTQPKMQPKKVLQGREENNKKKDKTQVVLIGQNR